MKFRALRAWPRLGGHVIFSGLIGLGLLTDTHGERLNIQVNGAPLGAAQAINISHESGGFEEGFLGVDDSEWGGSFPNPTQPEMKITTKPYGTELMADKRPLNSETMFHAELSAVDRNNPSTLINTSTNRFIVNNLGSEQLDTNRLYIGKFHRDASWNPSGSDLNHITNVVSALGGIDVGLFFDVRWPGVTNNLPSSAVYGTLDVSCKFTNQFFTLGNKSSATNNLSENQVSGLEYVLTSGTNVNGDAHIENGTNLVYAPGSSFVGTNNVNARLKWNGSDLGDINYQFNVTNQIIPPAIISQPQSQLVTLGSNATFTVTANGTAPLIYQWRFNGTNISSATATAYTKTNAQSADTGSYSVIVTNDGGSVTSSVATLLVITPDVSAVISSPGFETGGQFRLTVTGTTGYNYAVEASTNLALTNWISLRTNFSPFSFTDAVSVLHFQRYYRAVVLP